MVPFGAYLSNGGADKSHNATTIDLTPNVHFVVRGSMKNGRGVQE